MRISFAPQRFAPDETTDLTITRQGDILWINGDRLDLTVVGEGDILRAGAVANRFVAGDIHRVGGVLHLTVIVPARTGTIDTPPDFINPPDGIIALPDCLTEPSHG